MSRRLPLLFLALFPWLGAAAAPASAPADRPNLILILADDLGYADIGCFGNTFNETPRLDRLAREGLRFTQFYAGPVCSPTRTNLQSGQDQARFGITQHIPGHRRPYAKLIDPVVPSHLPLEVVTFAECLRAAGYATGYFGKWHLGGQGFGPADQGWTTALEFQGNTLPPKVTGSPATRRTAEFVADQGVAFITAHKDEPFLLQLSHFAVHIPLSTRPELLAKYQARPPRPGYPSRAEYAGLLEELDQSVGRIVDTVDRLGLAEKTLILFLSDNGGLEHEQGGAVVTSNAPLRAGKGTLYEGGIRIPAIARWPGSVPAGVTCPVPATTIDVHPTFVELGRAATPAGQPRDGASLATLLRDPRAAPARDTFLWHLPHYHHSTPASAIRRGDWKLLEFFEDHALELYNLRTDPGETTNLAAQEADRARELQAALVAWRHDVGALMPRPNPAYDPARATELATGRDRKARE